MECAPMGGGSWEIHDLGLGAFVLAAGSVFEFPFQKFNCTRLVHASASPNSVLRCGISRPALGSVSWYPFSCFEELFFGKGGCSSDHPGAWPYFAISLSNISRYPFSFFGKSTLGREMIILAFASFRKIPFHVSRIRFLQGGGRSSCHLFQFSDVPFYVSSIFGFWEGSGCPCVNPSMSDFKFCFEGLL
jgi:hypothetical protein